MTVEITQYTNKRQLVAAGRNELWHEDTMSAGTMIELALGGLTIDTTDQLNMFEAYQKALIVNGANLRVADFGTVKLTHSALDTAHKHGDILTQDNGSDNVAYMVVDFTNKAKTMTYGYAYYAGITTEFVITTPIITGNGSGSEITATAVTDPPHFHDWIPDIGNATAGDMPLKAYLGCLYNGRAVLSGDPTSPNQWYMSRQTNIYDWQYGSTDDQAAVRGGSSDLGELGDIVRCLAPYKDDYLIFGCASSIWTMFGDPRHGGAIRELSLTTGIFGARSYCWDNTNQFYFWGNNGLYRTMIPGSPQCVSQFKLPRVVKTEAASPVTHRITLLYDNDRHGILVAITVLATGENSNYWYDLNALDEQEIGSFFPETYPVSCSIYSGVYYDSNTPSLKGLLLGDMDGYIRVFDDDAKSDVASGDSIEIESFVCIGPMPMSDTPQRNGTLSGLDLTVAGAYPTGGGEDSNDVDFKVYTARTAEKTMKRAIADTGPDFAGTFTGPSSVRGSTRRQTVRNAYMTVRLQNFAVDESWAFEEMYAHLKDSGRKK